MGSEAVVAFSEARGWKTDEDENSRSQTILQLASMFIVFIHFIYMGANVQLKMNAALAKEREPVGLYFGDCLFAGVFGIELIVRMRVFGKQFYLGDDWRWN